MSSALHERSCEACEGGIAPMSAVEIEEYRAQISSVWEFISEQPSRLRARFSFRNYYQTVAFVNALAWVAHQNNHHPDVSFSYRECTVEWTTHAAQGLTLNDFICAAKTDALLEKPS